MQNSMFNYEELFRRRLILSVINRMVKDVGEDQWVDN